MAAVGDCFSIGSIVACKTCFDQTVEGEVLAFDPQTKMLILKCRSKNTEKLNDVYIINLQLCSDVQVKKEVSAIVDTPQPLNIHRLRTRIRNTIDQRQRWVASRNAGVSLDGQNLFMTVAKTLDQQRVVWQGHNIVVFNEVTISPPYTVENVTTGNSQNQNLLKFVKKMVENYFKTQATSNNATTASSTAAATNAITPTVGTSSNASASPVPAN